MRNFFAASQDLLAKVGSAGVRWLAYAHPIAMVGLLALAAFVLRDGLHIRRSRLLARAYDSRRHRRLARWLVGLLVLGFAGGLASMNWLRPDEPLRSVHFALAAPALLGFVAGGALGLRLERRSSSGLRNLHALCGAAGLLLGLAAGVAGFSILP